MDRLSDLNLGGFFPSADPIAQETSNTLKLQEQLTNALVNTDLKAWSKQQLEHQLTRGSARSLELNVINNLPELVQRANLLIFALRSACELIGTLTTLTQALQARISQQSDKITALQEEIETLKRKHEIRADPKPDLVAKN